MKVLFIFFIMQNNLNLKSYLLSYSHPYMQLCQKSKEIELIQKEKELMEKEKEITQKDIEIEKLKKEIEDLKKELKVAKDNQINYFLYGMITATSILSIIALIVGSQ